LRGFDYMIIFSQYSRRAIYEIVAIPLSSSQIVIAFHYFNYPSQVRLYSILLQGSGGFRPGPGGGEQAPSFAPTPSFVTTHFCENNTNVFLFSNFRKVGKFAVSIENQTKQGTMYLVWYLFPLKTKSAFASEGFAPGPLIRGSAPAPDGGSAPRPSL